MGMVGRFDSGGWRDVLLALRGCNGRSFPGVRGFRWGRGGQRFSQYLGRWRKGRRRTWSSRAHGDEEVFEAFLTSLQVRVLPCPRVVF